MTRRLLAFVAILVVAVVLLLDREGPREIPFPERPEASAPEPAPPPPSGPAPDAATPPAPERDPDRPWKLTVRVRDREGGCAGCRVTFVRGKGRVGRWTDESGEAVLEVTGTGDLVVRDDGEFAPIRVEAIAPPESGERTVEVVVDAGLEIAGTVLAQDGVTPAVAVVYAELVDPPAWLGEFSVEDDTRRRERFRLRGLLPGRYRISVYPRDEGDGAAPDPAPVFEAGSTDIRIVLAPQAVLTVKVVAEPGGPDRPTTTFRVFDQAGERVSNVMYQGERPEGMPVEVKPGGRYRVEVAAPGYRQIGSGEVLVGPNDLRAEIVVRIEPVPDAERARLTLRIRDARGSPVRRITIQRQLNPSVIMGDIHVLTDGVAELELPPGPSKLFLERPYDAKPFEEPFLRIPIDVDLAPGERAVRDVEVPCGGWIRFHLTEAAAEVVHRGSCVKLTLAGGEPGTHPLVPVEGGGFAPKNVKVLRPGRYDVTLMAYGMPWLEGEVTVRPFEITDFP
jgi:hypothetical protein